MTGASIELRFETIADERRFLREYLVDAWARFEMSDFFKTGWFWRFSQFAEYDAGIDGGLVLLVFDGEPDGLITAEEEHWQDFDGFDSWELHRYENPDLWEYTEEGYDSLLEEEMARKGETGGKWQYRLLPIAARFSLAYLREFNDPLPAVDKMSEDNRTGVGFWTHLHYSMLQCGYDWYDETDACLKGMKFRLKTLACDLDDDAARAEYSRLKTEWDEYEDELEEWLADRSDRDEWEL